jgi:hypothetical protein
MIYILFYSILTFNISFNVCIPLSQVLRTRLSRTPRQALTPPSGMQHRLAVQGCSPVTSPTPAAPAAAAVSSVSSVSSVLAVSSSAAAAAEAAAAALDNRHANFNADSSELEHSFLTMGLKSKGKKEKLDLQFADPRTPRRAAGSSGGGAAPGAHVADNDSSTDNGFEQNTNTNPRQEQASFGDLGAYSAHTPFVTPLRPRRAEEAGSAGAFSSFSSPQATGAGAGAGAGAGNPRGSEPRASSGHWTVHTFSSTPHRAGASKWSLSRAGAGAGAGGNDSKLGGRSPFIPANKRRPQPGREETPESSARKQTENSASGDAGSVTKARAHVSALDQELLNKVGREVSGCCRCCMYCYFMNLFSYKGILLCVYIIYIIYYIYQGSDIEYLCKEIKDVEKRVVELTNAALTLPFGENAQNK